MTIQLHKNCKKSNHLSKKKTIISVMSLKIAVLILSILTQWIRAELNYPSNPKKKKKRGHKMRGQEKKRVTRQIAGNPMEIQSAMSASMTIMDGEHPHSKILTKKTRRNRSKTIPITMCSSVKIHWKKVRRRTSHSTGCTTSEEKDADDK